jgi:hypothetical protein
VLILVKTVMVMSATTEQRADLVLVARVISESERAKGPRARKRQRQA